MSEEIEFFEDSYVLCIGGMNVDKKSSIARKSRAWTQPILWSRR